jgi:hypothetical protein
MGVDLTWIEDGLKKPGKTQSGLARALSRAPSMVTDLLKGKRQLKAGEISRIAEYLEVAAPSAGPREIEIIGLAGAGPSGEVSFSTSQGLLGTGPAPPGATDTTKAVEVRGKSMRGFADDGWLVYYDDEDRRAIEDDMIGRPCIVWLADGRVLIKAPYRNGDGTFNLESYNPSIDTIRGVLVESAALVTAIVPRAPVG